MVRYNKYECLQQEDLEKKKIYKLFKNIVLL